MIRTKLGYKPEPQGDRVMNATQTLQSGSMHKSLLETELGFFIFLMQFERM